MSQAADILSTSRTPYVRVVGAVSAAHFVSHYYIILLAPLLPLVRAEYGVSYTEIGLAFAAFNIVTAALQTPAGFLVDRSGCACAAGRRPRGRGERLCDCRPRRFILGVGGDVCARRRRQHGLSPGRLCAAVASCAVGSHWSGVFDSHICRHARFGGCASDVAHDAKHLGLARRLHRSRHARLCGRGDPSRDPRSRHRCGNARAGARRDPTKPRRVGSCCCPHRSCSISFFSCCSR